ncbi:MAG: HipA domain-containing protein [Pseudohongiellaceae bacterium]
MRVLARACGIQSAESRLITAGDRDVLLVKRFDREKTEGGYLRTRMVSGLTLLRTEDTPQHRDRWSYVVMAEELRRLSADPKRDAAELFRWLRSDWDLQSAWLCRPLRQQMNSNAATNWHPPSCFRV